MTTQEKTENIVEIRYEIRRSLRRTCQLTVRKDGTVVLQMPLLSTDAEAQELISRHRRWILKRILLLQEKNSEKLPEAENRLSGPEKEELKKKARKIIPERVAFYAALIGVDYGTIAYRFQKSRWGSCTKKGNLNFNCLLMLAPEEVLDSVVVHELCHRKQMNHSKEFYEEIYRVCPQYKSCHSWLKAHGDELMRRL